MMNVKIKFPKMQTKKVWAGMYGGHYSVIVFFHTKPEFTTEETHEMQFAENYIDLIDNKKCIAGAMFLDDFNELTGLSMEPEQIEIIKLHEMKLTAIWKDNELVTYPFNADGWI